MKRVVSNLLMILFVVGVLIIPAFHRAYGAGHDATHDATNCAICHVANTPVITVSSTIVPIIKFIIVANVNIQVLTIHVYSLIDPSLARAPPVC